jgi:nucleoside-diphosphate-sugar epimerase
MQSKSVNPLTEDLDYILDKTGSIWEELRGQRIFITGGTGFFGCWFLESFCWANDKLGLNSIATVLTRDTEKFKNKVPHIANHPAIQLFEGDVRTFEFPSGNFSHLIHAAVYNESSPVNPDRNLQMFDTILGGLQHVLEFASQSGINKLLLTSTGAVYGNLPSDGEMKGITENCYSGRDPTDLKNSYHEMRRMAENLCVIFGERYNIQIKIARGFAFVGPYLPLNGQFAIGNFINDGLLQKNIVIKGNGSPYRSYMYASDMVIWLWTILFSGRNYRPYNVGSEKAITIRDLAYRVSEAFDPHPSVEIHGSSISDSKIDYYVPSTLRAQNELNLCQSVFLEKGIEKTIKWHRG